MLQETVEQSGEESKMGPGAEIDHRTPDCGVLRLDVLRPDHLRGACPQRAFSLRAQTRHTLAQRAQHFNHLPNALRK